MQETPLGDPQMKVLLGIQARTNSKRLPGKIFEKIGTKSVLEWVWSAAYEAHRKLNAQGIESIPCVLGPANDSTLKDFCLKEGLRAHFPLVAEDDLIKRYLTSAYDLECNYIVRITADCWETHPDLIVESVNLFQRADYISNTIRRTFPEGLDLQASSRRALEWVDTFQKDNREHPFYSLDHNQITRVSFEKSGFKITELLNPQLGFLIKGSSIDVKEDLERAREFYERTTARKSHEAVSQSS